MSETIDEQLRVLSRGVVDLHTSTELAARLAKGRPLRIKAGFDPTAPDLHLGHTVLLTLLRRFQDLGHTAIFLVGDYTARIGDPTGKSATRPPLTPEQIAANTETYKAQVFKILDPARTEVRFNSEWLAGLTFADTLRLAAKYSASRTFERRDFKERIAAGRAVMMHELLYPLMQGYDSVALKCDVELGGTDQLFNLLVGRDLMERENLPPQIVMTTPLLEGLDGVQKMSKSLGNTIGINEAPEEQFGKLMSISDALMWRYFELLSLKSAEEIAVLKAGHPMAAKKALGAELVAHYHGNEAAVKAREHFERTVSNKEIPTDIETRALALGDAASVPLLNALAQLGLATSNSEARRLIAQGGVRVNGERVGDVQAVLKAGEHLVQAGKRRFVRVTVS